MSFKYDLTQVITGNKIVDLYLVLNTGTHLMLSYVFIAIFAGVTTYVILKVNNDPTLAFVQSGFMTLILSLVFYYWGVIASVPVIHGYFVLLLATLVSAGVGYLYYDTVEKD